MTRPNAVIAVGAGILAAACSVDLSDPRDRPHDGTSEVGTYALVDVGGQPLPAPFHEDGVTLTYIFGELELREDTTYRHRRVFHYSNMADTTVLEMSGQYERDGSELIFGGQPVLQGPSYYADGEIDYPGPIIDGDEKTLHYVRIEEP